MKKICIAISILMMLLITGCASDDELRALKEENQKLKAENEQMKRVYLGEEATKAGNNKSTNIDGLQIALGKPFSSPNQTEITIQNIFFTHDVVPEKKRSLYTHYPADAGKVYIVVATTIKNLSSEKVEADSMADATVIYDGSYKFDCMEVLVKRDDLDSAHFERVDPLNPETMYFMVELPAEAKDDSKSIDVQFKIHNEQFVYHYR